MIEVSRRRSVELSSVTETRARKTLWAEAIRYNSFAHVLQTKNQW